jgi:hypothetical protein
MKGWKTFLLVSAFFLLAAPSAWASPQLYEWLVNNNGSVTDVYDPTYTWDGTQTNASGVVNTLPAGFTSILGTTAKLTYSGAGSYSALAYFDYDFHVNSAVSTGVPSDDRYGTAFGSAAAGQTWEIGSALSGTIYADATGNTLTGANTVGDGTDWTYTGNIYSGDEIAMALGYKFNLTAGQTGTISWTTSTTAPTSGFYLADTDYSTGETVYFSENTSITGGGTPSVPEPATITFLALTLVGGIAAFRGKRGHSDLRL